MKPSANAVAVLFVLILGVSGYILFSTAYGRAWFWFFFALYPSSTLESSIGLAVFGIFMAAVYFSLILYASIKNKAVYAWVAIALLVLSGAAGYARLSISRSKSSRGKAHSSVMETKIWAERARPANRWPSSLSSDGYRGSALRHRACWQKSRPSAFAPVSCDPPAPPASDT